MPLPRTCRLLSIIIPMLNEEKGFDGLINKLEPSLDALGVPWEVVFVDDGSTDGTLAKLRTLTDRDKRYRGISLSRNFGKEIATAAGLNYARGDAAVIMDADLQHPPELVAEFPAPLARRLRRGLRPAHRPGGRHADAPHFRRASSTGCSRP